MRLIGLLVLLVLALGVLMLFRSSSPEPPAPHQRSTALDTSPVCPWRDPQHDLRILFPSATNYVLETKILSGMTSQIVKRLGRHMSSDENPLRLFRAFQDGAAVGTVLLTRVKGEHGAIEIVTGVAAKGFVQGLLIQSQREPEVIAQIITGPGFLDSFKGKSASDPLRPGQDLPVIPEEARVSAEAIAEGVRSQLIVLSFAELPLATNPSVEQNVR